MSPNLKSSIAFADYAVAYVNPELLPTLGMSLLYAVPWEGY